MKINSWALSLIMFASISYLQAQKISSELRAQMDHVMEDESIAIVVVLNDQPSLSMLQNISPQKPKNERRIDVVTYLKDFASNSQMGLRNYLQLRNSEGKASDLKFLWLTNAIATKAQKSVIDEISNRPEVGVILVDHAAYALSDVTWNVQKINADQVWSIWGYKGDGVLVSVLDTGIDYGHSDLHSNMWQNLGEDADGDGHTLEYVSGQWVLDPGDLNGVDDDGNGYIDDLVGYEFSTYYDPAGYDPMDDHDHGTHVSGTVAGDGTDGTQTGVAPEAKLMACKVLDSGWGYESEIWEAMEYSLDNGADVMNLSIGFIHNYHIPTCDTSRQYWRQNCDNAIAAGVTMVVAAGNERNAQGLPWYNPPPHQIRTPGDVPSVITVGATDINDAIASFSSAGPTTWECVPGYDDYPYPPGLLKPDVSAPGVNITSTLRGGGYQGGWNGTSMATPATSGTVALMLESAPNITPQMAKDVLEGTALDLGPAGKDSLYGSGRIDAYDAIDLIVSPPARPTGLTLSGEQGQNPELNWTASSSKDVVGYDIYRRICWGPKGTDCTPFEKQNSQPVQGTTWTDNNFIIDSGSSHHASWKVKAVDILGQTSTYSNQVSTRGFPGIPKTSVYTPVTNIPSQFSLAENYPNPFNPNTTIKYGLPKDSYVVLQIYDLLGRNIKTLVNDTQGAGYKTVLWDGKYNNGRSVPSGMYFYRLDAVSLEGDKKFHEARKMVLLR